MGIAAAFNFIATAAGLGFAVLAFKLPPPGTPRYSTEFPILISIFLVFTVFTLLGGIQALRGKTWRLTFASSIAAIILTPSLGIPALVFTVVYKPGRQPHSQEEPAATRRGFRGWLIPIFIFCIPLAAVPLLGMWL